MNESLLFKLGNNQLLLLKDYREVADCEKKHEKDVR
jgi:hypothetical protein